MDDHIVRPTTYDSDFYAWANQQAALLRKGRFAEADVENIAEEIESLGRSEKRELVNRLAVLLVHLLKWQFQPAWRGRSWRVTIKEQRRKVAEHLEDNPSLRARLDEAIGRAYQDAIADVQRETPLTEDDLPKVCLHTREQIFAPDFLPE